MGAGVSAVNRALAILDAYTVSDTALSLSALASRTGLYKSTILRLLESLQEFNHITRLADGRYALGPALFVASDSVSASKGRAFEYSPRSV